MAIDIKLPNIASNTEKVQIEQIKSYLYQLASQLNWAFNTIESGSNNQVVKQETQVKVVESKGNDPQSTFNSVKALIIKSAEIVNAYYEEISDRFSGEYVAQSDFGTYTELTDQVIVKNSTEIEQLFTNIQEIITNIDNLEHSIIEVNAHIRSGLLYTDDNGAPIYGLEIGQINEIDGVEVFNKYARFTSDRLSFYDQNDTEVAYISDYKLYITNAEITGTLTLGAFRIETNKGFTLKYVGRG